MMTPRISIISELSRGESFELSRETYHLGRDESDDIYIRNSTIGAKHCEFIRNEDRTYSIKDNNSTNSTYVNGKALTDQQVLFNGDIIEIGEIEIMFSCEGETSNALFSTQTNIDLTQSAASIPFRIMTNIGSSIEDKYFKKMDRIMDIVIVSIFIFLCSMVIYLIILSLQLS